MSTGSGKTWHYQEKTGRKEDFEEGGSPYKQMEWAKDCVMQALSKVLGESTGTLAKRIVDQRIGGVTRIDEMENGSVIKRVLLALRFTPLVEGGCTWATARHRMRGINGRLYGVWWYNRRTEDWTDKPVQIGQSDHAFSIWCNDSDIEVPTTNWRDFDTGHPTDDEWVSVFRPPTLIKCQKRTVLSPNSRDRRFTYA
jgi:hypothetical protein